MVNARVSIVIPSYNRPHKIADCLRACAAIDYPDYEVIVVDDGSTQRYEQIVEPFRDQLDLQLLRQENSGPAKARNLGVAHATGTFIAFTDDDCAPASDWLTNLIAQYQPDTMIGGRTINNLTGNVYSATSQMIVDMVYDHYNDAPDTARFFAGNNMFMHKSTYIQMGGYNDDFRFAEDREFCDRWRHLGLKLYYASDAIIYHEHDLTLWRYCKQHFRYGRGAWAYQKIRAERQSGKFTDDVAFHLNLNNWRRHLSRVSFVRLLQTLPLLVIWQLANVIGFAYEAYDSRRRS